MTPETLEALKGSIEKWRKIVEENGADHGSANCPLCQLHFRHGCRGCLIFEHTGFDACRRTPYDEWCMWCQEGPTGRRAETSERMAAARAELEFLRSLLPKEEGE